MRARLGNLMRRAVRGMPAVGLTPADVVHAENKWRLLRYRGQADFATPVLLVPSLINRHYVLDLRPGRSFVEFLVEHGHDVYMVDWGTPGDEDRYLEWDDIVDGYLGRAIRVAARQSGQERVHLLGYCLGGTLAAVHAAARPERVASLMLVAAPIDFHQGGLLARWTTTPTFDLDVLTEAFGNVPWPLMQASFHMLRPTLNLSKLVSVLDRAWDDEFLDNFAALERWGNDNVSFPGRAYRRYVQELYRENRLAAGTFTMSGRPARLDAIHQPVLVVSFAHDHIVPDRSATAALDLVSSADKELLRVSGGHVGAMVSRKARDGLWGRLSAWWAERDHSEAEPELPKSSATAAETTSPASPPASTTTTPSPSVVPEATMSGPAPCASVTSTAAPLSGTGWFDGAVMSSRR
ncbi:MAG TPA: alpha/beta fold hydrolase [Kofleriaceae bacterium]|nr:alpha/beta fold hydrolase [Kofleriaceae bacterium]